MFQHFKIILMSLLVCLCVFAVCSEEGHVKKMIHKTDLVIEAGINNVITKCLFDGKDGHLYAGGHRKRVEEEQEAPQGEQT